MLVSALLRRELFDEVRGWLWLSSLTNKGYRQFFSKLAVSFEGGCGYKNI
jgi:hypothetical protein